MRLHILLTDDIKSVMPDTCKIVVDFGIITVVFEKMKKFGNNCIVEDTEENIVNWLKPFDGFVLGSGNPQLESFEIAHVK